VTLLTSTFWRLDVDFMSAEVFNQPYAKVAERIYPHPKYRSFTIKKRGGGLRQIFEPRLHVKLLQQSALVKLRELAYPEKPCVHGFVSKRSIVTNAAAHTSESTRFVLNVDLADFFPSITFFRVRGLLMKSPFNFCFEVATVLAHLFTFNGVLPQGAPTSPFISNLICRGLDKDLTALAKRHRSTYTRYADDITFSFSTRHASNLPKSICAFDGGATAVGEELKALIEKHGFKLNEAKTRVSSKSSRQEVTGLTVNEFPNVRRTFVDSIRGGLHAWETYGYEAAEQNWQERIKKWVNEEPSKREWRRQTRKARAPSFAMLLWGRLLFLRMVRGKEDPLYNRLAERYNTLVGKATTLSSIKRPSLPFVSSVLTETEIDRAVYLIEWMGDYRLPAGGTEVVTMQGTAFAFLRDNLLISCNHVFTAELDSNKVIDRNDVDGVSMSVTNVATGNEYSVELIARDQYRDLALLKILDPKGGERHFRNAGQIQAQTPGWLIGHPNQSTGRHPTKSKTVVSAVFPKNGLRRLEVGMQIRKGNSGGPFTSLSFRLLGVVQEGATIDTGNNECLAVDELNAWLKTIPLSDHFGEAVFSSAPNQPVVSASRPSVAPALPNLRQHPLSHE